MLDGISALFRDGGFTLPPLLLMAMLMWYALGVRWTAIQGVARALRTSHTRGEVGALRNELKVGAAPIVGVVLTAPLLGLLGTVTGMIETFDSLATMELFSRSGGVAGGISEALLSTQAGLVVAIPGAIAGRLMTRRATVLDEHLEETLA